MLTVKELGQKARVAAAFLNKAGTNTKTAALRAAAQALRSGTDEILCANAQDLAAARADGMSESLLDRLALTVARIQSVAEGIDQIALLPDPIGEVTSMWKRPNGLQIGRMRVPLGVVGIIYEARPNVTADAAALCLMSGNASVLRGGKEAIRSNMAIADLMRGAIESVGVPSDAIQLVEDTSRDSANEMMQAEGLIDVLIPRGGAGLIKAVTRNSRVPVIETGTGICHVYVDSGADLDMAAEIVYNAKCSRPSVCNAIEGAVIAESEAAAFLPKMKALLDRKNVELRGDEASCAILPGICPVQEDDYDTEFLDYILALRVVRDIDEAITFINTHGTRHSEAIITRDYARARQFITEIDAAAVYVNASTRFTDGFEFGFGGEIGISTQKLHARGPLGLEALTTVKYTIYGDGQVR